MLLFSFDNIAGWKRILDVKSPANNNGLYALNGQLYFYPVVGAPSAAIAASNYVQGVLTRDASSNVVGYVNGVQQLNFVDTQNYATLAGSPEMLRFFKDEAGEDAPGTIARIRLYDKVMPPAQVATLDRLPGGGGKGSGHANVMSLRDAVRAKERLMAVRSKTHTGQEAAADRRPGFRDCATGFPLFSSPPAPAPPKP